MKIVFEQMHPLSVNLTYSGKRFLTAKARQQIEEIRHIMRFAYNAKPVSGPVELTVRVYYPNARKHDVQNFKVLYDALQGFLYEDDAQIIRLIVEKHIDRSAPRTEVDVKSLAQYSTPVKTST